MKNAHEIWEAFDNKKVKELRNLSEKALVEGFVDRDSEVVQLSVVAHSLSKILDKTYYHKDKGYWKNFKKLLHKELTKLSHGKGKVKGVKKVIVDLDNHMGRYESTVIHSSKIRQGSTLYAWGISLTLASELVGVPEYEMMKHIGSTKIVDEEGLGRSVSERLKYAEEVL